MTTSTRDRYVLDSFALLAYLRREPGWRSVLTILEEAESQGCTLWMSVANLGEVLYVTERRSGAEAAAGALGFVEQLPVLLVDVDRDRTVAAARVKAHKRLSHADAFAVALARELGAAVVTGDPEFREVEGIVPVHWIPRA